jgi:hypothetical protein
LIKSETVNWILIRDTIGREAAFVKIVKNSCQKLCINFAAEKALSCFLIRLRIVRSHKGEIGF